jgi:hypothetical protein
VGGGFVGLLSSAFKSMIAAPRAAGCFGSPSVWGAARSAAPRDALPMH